MQPTYVDINVYTNINAFKKYWGKPELIILLWASSAGDVSALYSSTLDAGTVVIVKFRVTPMSI